MYYFNPTILDRRNNPIVSFTQKAFKIFGQNASFNGSTAQIPEIYSENTCNTRVKKHEWPHCSASSVTNFANSNEN
jgi:hypothetical protein